MSKITTTEVIGIASVVISFATIFSTVGGLGANIGVQRFLGRSFSEHKLNDVRTFVKASIVLTIAGLVSIIVFILTTRDLIKIIFEIPFELIVVGSVFIVSSTMMTLLRYIIISSLKTKTLPLTMITSNLARIIVGTILVLLGAGALGLLIGFTIFPLIAAGIFSLVIIDFLSKASRKASNISLKSGIKMILQASIPTWVPFSIYTVGIHLGPIVVFGSHGASQAGVYAMAFFIVTAISASSSALFSIAYPKLSGMDDGRKRFAWKTIQVSIIISIPFSTFLIFYSNDIMGLLGTSYVEGALALKLLLLTMLPVVVTTGVNILVYSYGNYRHVLTIGLVSNLPRVFMYFLLVPIYGDEGAAISYSIGSILGFIVSIIISKRIGLYMDWRQVAIILLIPAGVAFALSSLGVNYIIAFCATLVITYLLFIKLNILMKSDIDNILHVLPTSTSGPLITLWSKTRTIFIRKKK